ncbi:MAG: hypothetical protein ACTSVV_06280 [Promethearchaeota archaeon]
MRIWITTVGWSHFAVINTLWAACFMEKEKFIPDKIILLNNGNQNEVIRNNVKIVEEWLKKILHEYGKDKIEIEKININENDIRKYHDILKDLIEKYKDSEIAIDMTPGRKYMSSIAMGLALASKKVVNKLYYLHLEAQKYQDRPFIKIPLPFQNLINILKL